MEYLAHAADALAPISIDIDLYILCACALAAIVACLVALFNWLLGLLERHKQVYFSAEDEQSFARVITVLIMLGVVGGGWDIWWHTAIGRDSLLEPPHFLIYLSALCSVIASVYAWLRSPSHRDGWRRIAVVMLLVPLSAPFDFLWHRIFGAENLATPMALSWSPPHAMLSLSIAYALANMVPILEREHNLGLRKLFPDLALGGILAIALFILWPFHPTEGFGQVLGFYGAGILAFAQAAILLVAEDRHWDILDATRVSLVTLILFLITYGREIAPQLVYLPHDRAPIWVLIFSVLVPGLVLDMTRGRMNDHVRGALFGILWSLFAVGVAVHFFAPEFRYGSGAVAIAMASSAFCGALAPFLSRRFSRA